MYDDNLDVFVHSSVGDLVPVMKGSEPLEHDDEWNGTPYRVRLYRPRVESNPLRAECWSRLDGSNTMHWRTISSENLSTILGQDADSRIFSVTKGNGEREYCFSWLASETYDSHGNQMTYSYMSDCAESLARDVGAQVPEAHRNITARSTQRYLTSIKYGNKQPNRNSQTWRVLPPQEDPDHWMFEVVFDYRQDRTLSPATQTAGDWSIRPDPFSTYTSGFEIRTYRRCERVLMFHHFHELKRRDCLVAATELQYQVDTNSGVSLLQSSTPWGFSPADDGGYSSLRLAPTTFEYWATPDLGSGSIEDIEIDLAGLTTPAAQWVDLNGTGAPGILAPVPGGGWYYHPNNSYDKPEFGRPSLVSQIPSITQLDGWSFEDFTGNGHLDVAFLSPDGRLRGFYERIEDGEWSNLVPFESYPTAYSVADPAVVKVDLNGNGHADLLRLAAEHGSEFSWYPSLGRGGYGPEKNTTGAPPVPSGDMRFLSLHDMTGDGLSDIVMIYSSYVCYWPNMGHGRFGSKVVMGNPPFLGDETSFSSLRIRMADITGTGTADLIYLPPEGGLRVYYNRSGNDWSDARTMPTFPLLDRFCAVDVFDIGGRGTQCLCWTSDHTGYGASSGATKVRFVDLMGGCKPGLMTKCSNGLGGEIEINYQSSTRYYLEDQRDGKPWLTNLPFPVYCVKGMIISDQIAQTSSSMRYAYHHGYYDPVERQFRGFHMVEEWDAEQFAAQSAEPFHSPPVLTRSWFYIGLQRIDDETILPGSYLANHPQQTPLPNATFRTKAVTERLAADELQDAYRALAGQRRRREIFGNDGSPKAAVPYLIEEQSHEVVMYQGARQGQQHGIFRVNGREETAIHYEREPSEAKVQHSLVLETDDYGNVLRQAVINYGKASSSLNKSADRQTQQDAVIIYTETDYTNHFDPLTLQPSAIRNYFQTPLVSEVRKYRVFSANQAFDSQSRCSWESLVGVLAGASETFDHGSPCVSLGSPDSTLKIPIGKTRTLYSTGDLTEPLPVGKVEQFSLEYQSYQLVATKELLQATLKVGESSLLDLTNLAEELGSGGYRQLDGCDDEWWAPSSRKIFADLEGNTPGNILLAARSQFYIPNAECDPYGDVSHQKMDGYWLLPVKLIDALKNETLFVNDYVHLQPSVITDANRNRKQTVFDACGRSVGVAIMGKAGGNEGDSLDGFSPTLTDIQFQSFMDNPVAISQELLGNAGRRIIYSGEYKSSPTNVTPAFQAELVRDTHYRNGSSPQIAIHITYLDSNRTPIQNASLISRDEGQKWQFSNNVLYNNKKQLVRQFLPFTTPTHHFQPLTYTTCAPATTLLRDSLDRVVSVLNADRTWTKTRFAPWSQVIFDAGDTVEIEDPGNDEDVGCYFQTVDRKSYYPTWQSRKMPCRTKEEELAVRQSKTYSRTPKTVHLDPLGREIVSQLDNGRKERFHDIREARTEYDVFGNISLLRDAYDRIVTKTRYDMLGQPLHSVNMDSGHHWQVSNCSGAPVLSWIGGSPRKRIVYDALQRVAEIRLMESPVAAETLVVQNVYGESMGNEVASENNLNGQLYECHDQSGKQVNHKFDFKGNCVESSNQYAIEYTKRLDWTKTVALDKTIYKASTSFNALGHPIQSTAVDGGRTTCRITRTYDIVGRLKSIHASGLDDLQTAVRNIEYSDDDRVTQIKYQNGVCTTNDYELETRRLIRARTERPTHTHCVQDVSYTHDCVGRVVQKADNAQQDIFFANTVIHPLQQFSYNALGQLIKATGREQIDCSQKHLAAYDPCSRRNQGRGDGRQMIGYEETYQYDMAGNIQKVSHQPQAYGYQGWARIYTYTAQSCADSTPRVYSNRLSNTRSSGRVESYKYNDNEHSGNGTNKYNGNGCITTMPGYSFQWDHDRRLHSFSSQRSTPDTTPETTWYIYNARGERVRKVTNSSMSPNGPLSPARLKETRYLPLRDVYTTYGGSNAREITTVSVSDPHIARTPIILMESIKEHNSPGAQRSLLRYQVSDNLELDEHSNVVSFEEFSPYGVSTYQTRDTGVPRKYRFASYQRDRESGLYLCGERYYAPWLARWMSPDPLGVIDGLNLYAYVSNDPVNFNDPGGTAGEKTEHADDPLQSALKRLITVKKNERDPGRIDAGIIDNMKITMAFQHQFNPDFRGEHWAILGVRAAIPTAQSPHKASSSRATHTTIDLRMDWDPNNSEKGYHVNFVRDSRTGDTEKIAFVKTGGNENHFNSTVARFSELTGWPNANIGQKLASNQVQLTPEEQTHWSHIQDNVKTLFKSVLTHGSWRGLQSSVIDSEHIHKIQGNSSTPTLSMAAGLGTRNKYAIHIRTMPSSTEALDAKRNFNRRQEQYRP